MPFVFHFHVDEDMDVANVASSSAKHGGNTDGPLSAGAGPIRHGRIPKVVSKTFDPSTQGTSHWYWMSGTVSSNDEQHVNIVANGNER